MKKCLIFSLILIVACGPSEEEIQERIDKAIEQAISTSTSSSSTSTTTQPLTTTTSSSTTTSSTSTTTSTTTTTTILKYQKNPNTLLPKIKDMKVYVDTNSVGKVEIIIELGYKVSDEMLNDYYAYLDIVFAMCYDYSGNTLDNATSNTFQACDGPMFGYIETWSYGGYLNTGSFFNSFNATKVNDYTIKYDLSFWLTNSENVLESERFFQLKRIEFRAREYGNEDCTITIRIDARLLKYDVEKSREWLTCENVDDKYSLDLYEISSFESFWNGKYFNGIPAFKFGNSSNNNETNSNISNSSNDDVSNQVNVVTIGSEFTGTIGSSQVNVLYLNNEFTGTIGSSQVNVLYLGNEFTGTIGSSQVNVVQIGSELTGIGPIETLLLFFVSD